MWIFQDRWWPLPGYGAPGGKKCKAHTRGLLRRIEINGGLQHCIGKEVSRFEEVKNDFIESVDDMCIHYDGGRVTANESLIAEISARGLRKMTKQMGLDRKTIRGILNGNKVKVSTLAKVVMGLREEWSEKCQYEGPSEIPSGDCFCG